MKRIIIVSILFVSSFTLYSQVFNTGQTLKPKTFSVGIEPVVLLGGNTDFTLFIHGGVGIVKGVDLGLSLGVLGPANYFGANVEFALGKQMSFAAGAHDFGVFGLDGTFNITFPIRQDIRIFTGGDLDINFADKTQFLLWLPVGLEVGIRKNVSFIFEAEIGLTDPAYHLIGGGLNFYF